MSCASILRSTKLTQPGKENDAKEIGYFLDILDLNKLYVHYSKTVQKLEMFGAIFYFILKIA